VDSEYSFVLRISISEFLLGFNMKYEVRRKTLAKKNVIVLAALVIAATLMIAGVLALITSFQTIPSHGTIAGVNLGVYLSAPCTDRVYAINWTASNTLNPGSFVTQQVYIVNTGTTDMTLSLSNGTWTPSDANTYLTLTWDLGTTTVVHPGVGNATLATLTLSASDLFTNGTTFDGNVIITGTHT
jgi:hypothetical protein